MSDPAEPLGDGPISDEELTNLRELQTRLWMEDDGQRLLARLDASESTLRAVEAERDALRVQVNEFRRKCDPREEHVLVTPWEMAIPAAAGTTRGERE